MRRLLLLLMLLAIALAAQAPAWLLARSVQERSGNMIELRNASGTIWNGQADAIFRGKTAGEREISAGSIAWRAVRIDWQHRALIFDVRQTPAGPRPLTLALGADSIRLAGGGRLPATVAGRIPLLAGWTIAGEVVVDTDALEWANGTGTGAATALWRSASLVPPDLPGGFALGEVTARITLDSAAIVASVRNSGGDIELTGDASSRTGTVALLLQPRAGSSGTSGAQIAWLQSHTMGRTPRGYTIDAGWPGR
jgi:Type II secretion system (T2SS), protein N